MITKLTDSLASIPDNVWAFLLFVLAAGLALVAHAHNSDRELGNFAGNVALTGAALFHGKDKKD